MEKQWSQTQEEEDAHRRQLLARARKGQVKAQEELWHLYGVRIWSEKDCSSLQYVNPTYKVPKKASDPASPARRRRKHAR